MKHIYLILKSVVPVDIEIDTPSNSHINHEIYLSCQSICVSECSLMALEYHP